MLLVTVVSHRLFVRLFSQAVLPVSRINVESVLSLLFEARPQRQRAVGGIVFVLMLCAAYDLVAAWMLIRVDCGLSWAERVVASVRL